MARCHHCVAFVHVRQVVAATPLIMTTPLCIVAAGSEGAVGEGGSRDGSQGRRKGEPRKEKTESDRDGTEEEAGARKGGAKRGGWTPLYRKEEV